MLADAEDEGVIRREACTLGLYNVQILTLSVRCGVAGEEVVRWILACVG